jgi:hypothetical protein
MRLAHGEAEGAAVFIPYREAMGEYAGGARGPHGVALRNA